MSRLPPCAAFLALAIAIRPAVAQQHAFPWKAGDPAPVVAGLHLAGSRASIDSVLGAPKQVQDMGAGVQMLMYRRAHGLDVGYAPADGIAIIYMYTRAAGAIDSVRVGDSRESVLSRWGPPSTVDGMVAMWQAGHWVVVVYLDEGGRVVERLGLGRVADPSDH